MIKNIKEDRNYLIKRLVKGYRYGLETVTEWEMKWEKKLGNYGL